MKRLISLAMLIGVVVLVFSGCGSKKVSESQILADLNKLDFTVFAYQSSYTNDSESSQTFEKVIKRQTNAENKEDIIFYEVLIKDQYFQTTLSVEMVYNYYDEGGWILDEHSVERTKVEPIAFPEKDLVVGYLSSESTTFHYVDNTKQNYTQNFNLIHFHEANNSIEWKTLDKTTGTATFEISATIDNAATISGEIDMYFDEENGWSFYRDGTNSVFRIENKIFNYNDKCIGRYEWNRTYANFGSFHNEYQIYGFDPTTEKLDIADDKGRGSIDFDPLTVNGFMTSENKLFYYSTKDDTWNFGDQKYFKQD